MRLPPPPATMMTPVCRSISVSFQNRAYCRSVSYNRPYRPERQLGQRRVGKPFEVCPSGRFVGPRCRAAQLQSLHPAHDFRFEDHRCRDTRIALHFLRMARCGVRCEYEQVSLLVVTVERIRAVGDPFRYGGQRQYMVPPEKTHETFVYCFAAAARFGRPGFRASGRFRNRGVPFRSRDSSLSQPGLLPFSFPEPCVPSPVFPCPASPLLLLRLPAAPFSRPFPLPPYALFRCRGFACRGGSRRSLRNYERIQLRDALFVLHLAVQLGRDAVAYEFERRPVLFCDRLGGVPAELSAGRIGVPFFQMR